MEEMSRRSLLELEALMKKKLLAAGLPEAAASETAAHLTFADACGIHSHGAVRMDYYAERLVKGGITLEPNMSFEKQAPLPEFSTEITAWGIMCAMKRWRSPFIWQKKPGSLQ